MLELIECRNYNQTMFLDYNNINGDKRTIMLYHGIDKENIQCCDKEHLIVDIESEDKNKAKNEIKEMVLELLGQTKGVGDLRVRYCIESYEKELKEDKFEILIRKDIISGQIIPQ